MAEPYTDAEAAEAREWSNRHGPSNAWTAGNGTAARMIGRLLNERDRLRLTDAELEAIAAGLGALERLYEESPPISQPIYEQHAPTLRGLLERTRD
jgi:hypothetical protein